LTAALFPAPRPPCYPDFMGSYDEEKHLMKIVLTWAIITFLLLGLAIGLVGLGLGFLVQGSMP
jgi:hypothetical protein